PENIEAAEHNARAVVIVPCEPSAHAMVQQFAELVGGVVWKAVAIAWEKTEALEFLGADQAVARIPPPRQEVIHRKIPGAPRRPWIHRPPVGWASPLRKRPLCKGGICLRVCRIRWELECRLLFWRRGNIVRPHETSFRRGNCCRNQERTPSRKPH